MKNKVPYNKYGNNKVRCQGEMIDPLSGELVTGNLKFDSEDEADRYFCLLDKYKTGEITKLERQVQVTLVPKVTWMGKLAQRAITYTLDFFVEYADGRREFEDVKGFSTQQGDLRRKLYNWLSMTQQDWPYYGVPLRWVASSYKWGDADGWVDYDELQKIRAQNRKAKKGA